MQILKIRSEFPAITWAQMLVAGNEKVFFAQEELKTLMITLMWARCVSQEVTPEPCNRMNEIIADELLILLAPAPAFLAAFPLACQHICSEKGYSSQNSKI